MAKKKKKKKQSNSGFSAKLAKQIKADDPADLATEAAGAGIDPEAFADAFSACSQMLKKGPDPRKLIALPPPFQVAFLTLAEEDEDDELIGDLLSMSDSKEVKKEAKRILHRLRSRGLSVDLPESSGPSVLDRVVETEEKLLPCHLSPPSGTGSRMVLMARYGHGGVAVHQGELNDQDGLVQFAGGTIGRNRYRQMSKEMMGDSDESLLEISYAEARLHLARAADISREAGKPIPDEYLQASSELGEVDEGAAPKDPQEMFPAAGHAEEDMLDHGPDLLDLPEFADWLPDEETIETIDEKIKEVEQGKVAINDQQRIEQVQKAIDQVPELMLGDEQKRQVYRDRLLQSAAYLARTERSEQASWAAASAWQLVEPEFQASDSKLFVALAKKMFRSAEEIVAHMAPPDGASDGDETPAGSEPGGNIVLP